MKLDNEKNLMQERGKITLNGYEFTVLPIFLGEEERYLNDVRVSPTPIRKKGDDENREFTDKEISAHIRAIFSNSTYDKFEHKTPIITNKIALWFIKKFDKKHYYADKHIKPLLYWLQTKVEHKGKLVTFYALERKYKLSKAEIGKIIILMHELSGF